MIDEGTKYEYRFKGIIEIANNAFFNVGELQVWAEKNKHPFNFTIFYKDLQEIPLEHHYHSFEGLAWNMAQHHKLLNISKGNIDFSSSYETDVDRLFLCAIFDGEIDLYNSSLIKIDVEALRRKYNQFPEQFINEPIKHKDDSVVMHAKDEPSTDITSIYEPYNAIGKLAVKAAIEIEHKLKKRAIDKQVFKQLEEWATNGSEASVLRAFDNIKNVVVWLTDKQKENKYTLEACQKTLGKWNKGRQ